MCNNSKANRSKSGPGPAKARGFTLVELVTMLGITALVALTLLPALARSGPNVRTFQCVNNLRQLQAAWRMYASDNNEFLLVSSDDGTGAANRTNGAAWTSTHLDYTAKAANWDPNAGLAQEPLWPYVGRSAAAYKCPTDESFVLTSAGVARPRIRSMAMNIYFGGFGGGPGGVLPANFRCYFKTSDLSAPGPAQTMLFLDEREDFVNWGAFYTDMTGYVTNPSLYVLGGADRPNNLHEGAGNFVFSDGHAETHHWQDARTFPALYIHSDAGASVSVPRNPDVAWLQTHVTAPR